MQLYEVECKSTAIHLDYLQSMRLQKWDSDSSVPNRKLGMQTKALHINLREYTWELNLASEYQLDTFHYLTCT